ncbi:MULTISPECIES: hypothetical protein [unclassified Streptomyces]|uniref:hypothetical protein n=1 Tax=unclassified Streptomyces TaxID=2593676 RepID=UPI00224F5AA1|nr:MULTISPECIES: hypothetical protein [unclassified Streptomyces]MCX4524143.1 hypothetical protein [Streptomyces sp. NBC_01551]MCX4545338.1 hypothetical protein [Streptomyces sp. NBC_01565]
MNAAGEGPQLPDAVSVANAKTTLLQLLARAGVYTGDAEELIGLVAAGSLARAYEEIAAGARTAPGDKGEPYDSGWLDGARDVVDALGGIADQAVRQAVGADASDPSDPSAGSPEDRPRVRRMEVERAQVAVSPLYLSFASVSDFDPEVTTEVLTAVLGTLGSRQRALYAGRLTEFSSAHQARLERLYAEYGPGSAIAIHGRYSLIHSPTSLAVLERLATAPAALREEWDAGELPPAWLDGLTTAWDASA